MRVDDLRQRLWSDRLISHMTKPVDVRVRRDELIVVASPYSQLPLGTIVERVRQQRHEKMIFFLREYFR